VEGIRETWRPISHKKGKYVLSMILQAREDEEGISKSKHGTIRRLPHVYSHSSTGLFLCCKKKKFRERQKRRGRGAANRVAGNKLSQRSRKGNVHEHTQGGNSGPGWASTRNPERGARKDRWKKGGSWTTNKRITKAHLVHYATKGTLENCFPLRTRRIDKGKEGGLESNPCSYT